MSFHIIENTDQLVANRDCWNALTGSRPFQSWEWCANWLTKLEIESQPFVMYETDSNGDWTGIAPMALCLTKFGRRKIYVMGSGKACTDYTSLVPWGSSSGQFAYKFGYWLKSQNALHPKKRIEVVEFDGIELETDSTSNLIQEMEQAGYRVHELPLEHCWRMSLAENWENLNSRFSKKHRRKTKKALSRLQDPKTKIEYATSGNFERLWRKFVELHQRRRAMTGMDGCFSDPKFGYFLRSAARGLIERDLGELIQISIDQNAVASTLLFHDHQNAFMYQTGFEPEQRAIEPGYMLIVASLLWALERKFKTFDFLRGDEPYKTRWKTNPIKLAKLRFVEQNGIAARVRDFIWHENLRLRKKASWLRNQLVMSRDLLTYLESGRRAQG